MIELFFRNLWLWKCGLPENSMVNKVPELTIIKETQWSVEFEELMRNRLVMGAFRYGMFGKQSKKYDHTSSIPKRLELYKQTKNAEYLVDIANLCMAEYIDNKPKLCSIDDDNVHSNLK
ncbi:MAG TPA: hypothetical protein PKY56_00070 [Candidatus Kapabacteria bacterium]|nr:hypothetical protein [Candidatus Kapabacteria bacterium]